MGSQGAVRVRMVWDKTRVEKCIRERAVRVGQA